MAAAGLIFGQFVPNANIDWRLVLGGGIISLALVTLAGLLKLSNGEPSKIITF